MPARKVQRPTGLESTVSAVPERISWATLDDAHNTAPNSPDRSIRARDMSFTSLGSSPNPKYGTAAMNTQKPADEVISSRKIGCRTNSMNALSAMDAKDRMVDVS